MSASRQSLTPGSSKMDGFCRVFLRFIYIGDTTDILYMSFRFLCFRKTHALVVSLRVWLRKKSTETRRCHVNAACVGACVERHDNNAILLYRRPRHAVDIEIYRNLCHTTSRWPVKGVYEYRKLGTLRVRKTLKYSSGRVVCARKWKYVAKRCKTTLVLARKCRNAPRNRLATSLSDTLYTSRLICVLVTGQIYRAKLSDVRFSMLTK